MSQEARRRPKTIGGYVRLTEEEKKAAKELVYNSSEERPFTRDECMSMPRPCPFVSCTHHLYLDVNNNTGAIKMNFPGLEIWEIPETCSLDVADRGGLTLEEVGAIVNLTRERIRQVETKGLMNMKKERRRLGLLGE